MTEVETEFDSRYDDVDVESILARCRRKVPMNFSRKTCLYQAPEFIKRLPATEEVEEGSTVSFTCKVAGIPKPTVTWYRDEDIIGPDSRAKVDAEDSGIHSIHIKDVSKCDAGIYKIQASNLEARSKRRNKKKSKRSMNIARSPLFPAIIERVAEEQKETLENERQPESPLTPIYCTISRKAPVIWPVFLGDWAYNEDEALHQGEIEELGIGCEDVFDTEVDNAMSGSLTFVSAAYTHMCDPASKINSSNTEVNGLLETRNIRLPDVGVDCAADSLNMYEEANVKNEFSELHPTQTVCKKDHLSEESSATCDMLNNNDKDIAGNYASNDWEQPSHSQTNLIHQTALKSKYCDPSSVSIISVHRSYAKGDSTSSVARRSPSPFSQSRSSINGVNNCHSDCTDTSTLQNLNNERILHRMNKETSLCHKCWHLLCSFATTTKWENYLWEIIFFISGSTFMALCFDLPPTTFIYYILVAMCVKMALYLVLGDL
ncbi:muscle M-line assembly protein unc-89-like isoform X2 [Ruditapes philippinarum]|uniref:muscle M-line assembly protein unc-89-like isoform X2 n=1 Tax=Ruditapes philippinarum TaxID=129788 RepID=UPI00295A6E0F|nr:muscle M-line assembly protein unc-89-like isoform X2 [Ruditapes philippinarum]